MLQDKTDPLVHHMRHVAHLEPHFNRVDERIHIPTSLI